MNLFRRINDILNANVNDVLDRIEDPDKMLRQLVREMEQRIADTREEVVRAITSEKQLARELRTQQQQAEHWQVQAERALVAKDEALARAALNRKQSYAQQASRLQQSWQTAKNASDKLKEQLQTLQQRLDSVRHKQAALAARQQAAIASTELHYTKVQFDQGLNDQMRLDRIEVQVSGLEARAEALAELDQDQSPLEQALINLEVEQAVDADLEALKAKLQR